jgi:putative transposase
MLNHHLQILCKGINGTGKSRNIATDKLENYGVAHPELIPNAIHNIDQYANNRAEQSPEAIRVSERVMRRFKSVK